jgi:hypothetical protein
MATELKPNPLPAKMVLSASFHEIKNPEDPTPQDDIPTPDEYPYLRLGVLHAHRSLFFPTDVVAGPLEQTISTSPGESVEVTMELTRRVTVEEENETRGQLTTETLQERNMQDEFTDRISTVLQDAHTTSVSLDVTGSIAVISGSVGVTDTYSSTQTTSKEQMRRTVNQTTQRVSQQLMKSYMIRSRRSEDVTTRDTFRRLLRNETTQPMHFGFRKTLQQYRTSVQYLGPQLVWHTALVDPGISLGGPRIVSPTLLPGAFMQQAMRMMLLEEATGFDKFYDNTRPVFDRSVPFGRGSEAFIGARFLNGRDTITVNTIRPTYSVEFNLEMRILSINLNNSTVMMRFIPNIKSQRGNVPPSIQVRVPDFQLITVKREVQIATDSPGTIGVETFLEQYRAFLTEASSIEMRPSGDLRQEERSHLLQQALRPFRFTTFSTYQRVEDIKEFDEIFDLRSAFYNLYPPHYNSAGIQNLFQGSGVIPEYDTFKSLPPARYGASLGWKLQLDGDARRTEFINSPLARLGIPIAKGREADAVAFLLKHRAFRLSKNSTETVAALLQRRAREARLAELGKSESDVDLQSISEVIDEATAPDEKLVQSLFPVTAVFQTTDPLAGFIYEPIEL